MDWGLIRQQKETQINKDNFHKNTHRVDYDHQVGDNVMLTKHIAYKYKMPYMGSFVIIQCFINGTVKLQNCVTQIRYNKRRINPYKLDTKFEYSSSKNMSDDVNIKYPVV